MLKVCPELSTLLDNSMSPPPPVDVTEHRQTSNCCVDVLMMQIVAVPATVTVPSVIVFAVLTPVEAAPNAVDANVSKTSEVDAAAVKFNCPNVEPVLSMSIAVFAIRLRMELG